MLLINAIITIQLFTVINVCSAGSISVYPLTDQYFDQVYVIQKHGVKHYLKIHCKQANMLSISITEDLQFEEAPRFMIYPQWAQKPKMQTKQYTFLENCNMNVNVNLNGNLIEVSRADQNNQHPIFSIKDYNIKTSNNIEIETVDSSIKWGMGQRFQHRFNIMQGQWTIWNRDRPWKIDTGSRQESGQTYGHQPVYLAKEAEITNKFHLVYFKNTHGFNYIASQNTNAMKYIVTGGNIHFIIIIGDKPEQILQQYHRYIGNGHVPPFWSLGYHQSRWGYKHVKEVEQVVSRFDQLEIPLDTMWSDLDYMLKKAIFTVDEDAYPPERVQKLIKNQKIHYVPLIDVGVSIKDGVAVELGNKMNVFMQAAKEQSNQSYIGDVWPGKVHFVDFLHPNSSAFWENQLQRLFHKIPFSGVWLDMNEPSNFQGNEPIRQAFRVQHQESINMMTIDCQLNHYLSANNQNYTRKLSQEKLKHFEVHAYYGHLSTLPTHNFLKRKHGRAFIISRSNSVGSGHYAGHWTGDNVATWDFLRLSISGNFLFQIFGIQMVGADICGFRGNTGEELCSRWMQVGSMYPFARNHNENEGIPQQPYQFGQKSIETARLSLGQRYALLKHMYSTMVILNGTGSFYRPMLLEFPDDHTCYVADFSETQFMIGDYLLGAPIVEKGAGERQVYFPGDNETWFQLFYSKEQGFNHNRSKMYHGTQSMKIENILPAPPNLFLRGGRLVLTNKFATRTTRLDSKFTIIAALNNQKVAQGQFLAILDFHNEQRITDCINSDCAVSLKLTKTSKTSMALQWSQKMTGQGGTFIFPKIRILEQSKVYESVEPVSLQLSQLKGKRMFSISTKV